MRLQDRIITKEKTVQAVAEKAERTQQLWLRAHRKYKALLRTHRHIDGQVRALPPREAFGDSDARPVDLIIAAGD